MFTTAETPAGTRVVEADRKHRKGYTTGQTRVNRQDYTQHLVKFDGGDERWCTWLKIVEGDDK